MHLSSKTNIIILLYISLLLGFYFGEDSLGGAFNDYQSHNHISDKFNINFFDTLLNYDKLGHRHSPIFYIIKSLLIEDDTIRRLIFLHFYILIPIFFYKSLKIVFKNSSKTNLRLVASTLLLFPTDDEAYNKPLALILFDAVILPKDPLAQISPATVK